MIVGVIGAGRVGAVLGAALRAAGHEVVAVSGASPAAKHASFRAWLTSSRTRWRARATDLLIVAVPDDALAGVISGLAGMGVLQPGQIVAHTSGAHGLDVLAPAVAAGARPLALHPAMTFAGTAADLDRLRGISFGVTAPPSMLRDRRRRWSTTSAARRSGSPTRSVRSTTPRSRTAPTTW